jgi:hypothetical protein
MPDIAQARPCPHKPYRIESRDEAACLARFVVALKLSPAPSTTAVSPTPNAVLPHAPAAISGTYLNEGIAIEP